MKARTSTFNFLATAFTLMCLLVFSYQNTYATHTPPSLMEMPEEGEYMSPVELQKMLGAEVDIYDSEFYTPTYDEATQQVIMMYGSTEVSYQYSFDDFKTGFWQGVNDLSFGFITDSSFENYFVNVHLH